MLAQGNGFGYGFDLTSRSNVTITKCTITSFSIGVHVYFSSDVFLLNNNVRSNVNDGLQIIASNRIHLLNNNLTHNGGSAIWIDWSTENNISGNYVADNNVGVMISASSAVVKNNSIKSNNYNFGVDGEQLSHFMIDVDTSNTINDRPIYYWVNKQNMEVPFDAGYVAVINSTDITVKNLTLMNNYYGILSCFTSNLTIQNVSSSYNYYGIAFFMSSNSNIANCSTETGYCGILLQDSSNNSITRNRINSLYGFKLVRSSDNRIYYNNLLNNVKQANVDAESTSAWDNGYPSGGNYWSDYAGVDLKNGPYQNITGSDGIGDTPYYINEDNQDNYPLTEPLSLVKDEMAPTIGIPSYTPSENVPLNQGVTVTVNVADVESGVKNVTLSYKLGNATSWASLAMNYNITGDLYETVIPGQPNRISVSFKITAFDNAENMATMDNAGEYYVYNVVPEQFALIALLSLMTVSSLIVAHTRRKHIGARSPTLLVRKA